MWTAEDAGWEAFFVWDHLGFVWNGPAGDPWIVPIKGGVALTTTERAPEAVTAAT